MPGEPELEPHNQAKTIVTTIRYDWTKREGRDSFALKFNQKLQ